MPFHGLKRNGYFEGWYYKQVSSDEKANHLLHSRVSARDGTVSPFIQAILAARSGMSGSKPRIGWMCPRFNRRRSLSPCLLGESGFSRDGLSIVYPGERLRWEKGTALCGYDRPACFRWARPSWAPFPTCPGHGCIHGVDQPDAPLSAVWIRAGEAVDFTGTGAISATGQLGFPSAMYGCGVARF